MLVINFKNYPETIGAKGLNLARELELVAQNFPKVETILAVSPVEVFRISSEVNLPIFSQHVDPFETGQTTGFITPEALREAGAKGTLINHSEHPLSAGMIGTTIRRCRDVGLTTIVCAASPAAVEQIKKFEPNFIAYEPPELIGGDVSVVEAEPQIISEAVALSSPVPLLVGAGVHSRKDIETARRMRALGVLVSSDIVLAEKPQEEMRDLLDGFR